MRPTYGELLARTFRKLYDVFIIICYIFASKWMSLFDEPTWASLYPMNEEKKSSNRTIMCDSVECCNIRSNDSIILLYLVAINSTQPATIPADLHCMHIWNRFILIKSRFFRLIKNYKNRVNRLAEKKVRHGNVKMSFVPHNTILDGMHHD